jgi:hypothetical protein
MNYTDAEKASWLEVEKGSVHTGVNPHSIHFPLNIPKQNYLIYCDCAFNVYRLDVPPDMRANDINSDKVRADIRLPLVSFAFDEPAFIPDFRQSIWERIGGSYPMAHGRLYATLMQYDFHGQPCGIGRLPGIHDMETESGSEQQLQRQQVQDVHTRIRYFQIRRPMYRTKVET